MDSLFYASVWMMKISDKYLRLVIGENEDVGSAGRRDKKDKSAV